MSPIRFNRDFDPRYGEAVTPVPDRAPDLIRVVAENPGPFTFFGTGTYILGARDAVVIDPGPAMESHLTAILAALDGRKVSAILVTHTHRDHSPLAAPLSSATGAPVLGCSPHGLAERADGAVVEEGMDPDYAPDRVLSDGETVAGEGWSLEAVATPGHTSNHLCYSWRERKILFPGDHVMGWSTSVIVPPDGDMAAYLASLEKLLMRDEDIYLPTHGAAIRNPDEHVRAFIAHRREREHRILETVAKAGSARISDIVGTIYTDVPANLHPAAARSVHAHLIQLVDEGRVRVATGGPATLDAVYLPT